MAIDLTALNLPDVGIDGFFNELETEIKSTIENGGSGLYKLSQNQNGVFVNVESTNVASEDNAAIDTENNDRVISNDENFNYVYVKFSV